MRTLLQNATEDMTGPTHARTGQRAINGIVKYSKTGTGTCTLTLYDAVGAVIETFSVPAGNPSAASKVVRIPAGYYAAISEESGAFDITVWMDGDA